MKMESARNEKLKHNKASNSDPEVVKLRDVLTTVTEALILIQEFLESEVGEISYFRDSGCQQKLVQAMDYLRSTVNSCNIVANKMNIEVVDLEHEGSNITTAATPGETSEQIPTSDAAVKVEVDMDSYDDHESNIVISEVHGSAPIEERNNNIERTPKRTKKRQQVDMQDNDDVLPKALPKKIISPNQIPVELTVPLESIQDVLRQSYPSIPISFTTVTVEEYQHQQQVVSISRIVGERDAAHTSPVLASSSSPSSAISILADVALSKEPLKLLENRLSPEKNKVKEKKIKEKKENFADNIEKLRRGRRSSKKTADGSPPSGSVECPHCHKMYSSKGVMSRHVKESHSIEPQFPCFYCDSRFRNGPGRLEHMNNEHPNEMKSVICPYCNRISKTITAKRNHMMLCKKVKPEGEEKPPSKRGRKAKAVQQT